MPVSLSVFSLPFSSLLLALLLSLLVIVTFVIVIFEFVDRTAHTIQLDGCLAYERVLIVYIIEIVYLFGNMFKMWPLPFRSSSKRYCKKKN